MEQINKVRYTGEGVEVRYTLTAKGYAEEITEYIKDEPHGDFLAALRALGAHFAVLSELRGIPADYIRGFAAWDAQKVVQSAAGRVSVEAVRLKEDDTIGRCVVLAGRRTLAAGGVLSYKLPALTPTSPYAYLHQFTQDVDTLLSETRAYLFEGKRAAVQGDLFAPADAAGTTSAAAAADAAPARRSTKNAKK